ncbi:hypothetical protein BH20GEM2_BH20GEM2_17050 [soil metagenome]
MRDSHLDEWQLELAAEDRPMLTESRDHLLGCADCLTQVERLREIALALASLPRFAPSAGFADAVMARVAVAPAAFFRWLPATRAGWLRLAAALLIPLIPVLALAAWLLSRPLVTAPALLGWAGDQLRDGFWAAVLAIGGAAVRSGLWDSVGDGLSAAAGTLSGDLLPILLFLALVPFSMLVLIRLSRTPNGGVTHAH